MNKEDLRLIFMGTPQISAYVFQKMIENGYHFVGLIAQPDKASGRHGETNKVPTKIIAEHYHIPVFQPSKIRKEYEFVKELNPDLIVTLAYGQIIPQALLDIPRLGCLNLHGSLLPKYRGAAPIQYSLINNDKLTGMTLMKMVSQMDAGEMYAKKTIEIDENDNCSSLFNKMAIAAEHLIIDTLPRYIKGELTGIKQNEDEVSFCPTIKPQQEKIDFSMSKEQIHGWIRALSNEPGAYFMYESKKVKVFKSKILNDNIDGEIGEIIQADKKGLVIQLINGQMSLLELQKEGKKRIDYLSFVNGERNIVGKVMK